MGGGLSTKEIKAFEEEIVLLMMPVYYIPQVEVTSNDILACQNVWNLILDEKSIEYQNYLKTITIAAAATTTIATTTITSTTVATTNNTIQPKSCIEWFYSIFYDRLFNVHPLCRPLFTKGIESLGTFLVQMISLTLSQLRDSLKFKKTMRSLAIRHCERGVKAIEYGIIGEVLFYALKKCLGLVSYTIEVENSWKKVYSAMLREIVPLVVNYERNGKITESDLRNNSGSEADKRKSTEE